MKLKDSCGRLTAYGFSCGYVEVRKPIYSLKNSNDRLTLSKVHNLYFIKGFLHEKAIYVSTHTLKEARRLLGKMLTSLKSNI